MNTKYENLKIEVIELFNTFLKNYEDDIESGIDDKIYDPEDEDNIEARKLIKKGKQVINEFSKYEPEIYIRIEGHNIQGISGTEKISINKLDIYDCKHAPEELEMTREEWDLMIDEKTNKQEIKAIS